MWPKLFTRRQCLLWLSVFVVGAGGGCAQGSKTTGVTIKEQPDKLRIEINGDLFCEYNYSQSASRPYVYPILGPGGLPMTRDWPMREVEGEDRDHVHHRSLWWAHGDVNGTDFWSESPKAGKTTHDRFLKIESGPKVGVIKSLNKLVAIDGNLVAMAEQTLRFGGGPDEQWIDFEVAVKSASGDLTFGDTKEGTMALRLAETMRLKPNKAGAGAGHIVNSEGLRDGATWGKRAAWVDYHGPVKDQILGVSIFDHPKNPRHPTWWHVRDYGLFAANPFGLHDFEKQPTGAGKLVVPAGESVTFRYRFYFHRGDEKTGRVAERYAEYLKAEAQ